MTQELFGFPTWYLPALVSSLIATGMGVVVTWQAYRGFRRHDARPMLYLAVGLGFLTVVPFFLDLFTSAFVARQFGARSVAIVVPTTNNASRILGLAFVLYSLYGRRPVASD